MVKCSWTSGERQWGFCMAEHYQRSKATDNDAYTGPILFRLSTCRVSATVYNPLDGSYGGVTTEDPSYIENMVEFLWYPRGML